MLHVPGCHRKTEILREHRKRCYCYIIATWRRDSRDSTAGGQRSKQFPEGSGNLRGLLSKNISRTTETLTSHPWAPSSSSTKNAVQRMPTVTPGVVLRTGRKLSLDRRMDAWAHKQKKIQRTQQATQIIDRPGAPNVIRKRHIH